MLKTISSKNKCVCVFTRDGHQLHNQVVGFQKKYGQLYFASKNTEARYIM